LIRWFHYRIFQRQSFMRSKKRVLEDNGEEVGSLKFFWLSADNRYSPVGEIKTQRGTKVRMRR